MYSFIWKERTASEMNILVIGCGNVGAALCSALSAQGHDVSVISSDKEQFSNLSADFNGYTTLGVPIDKEVLKKAGIENCDALAAVTSDDNTNLMVIQLAKQFFSVPKVFARVNDPKKNEVFSGFGLETICPTNTTVTSFCAAINSSASSATSVGGHSIVMEIMDIPKDFIGKRISEIEFEENETLAAIERSDGSLSMILLTNYELQKGDKLVLAKFAD